MPPFLHRQLVFANRKGGCGKTTTAVNVARALASLGRRTLLVDVDPQAHATISFGLASDSADADISRLLRDQEGERSAIREVVRKTEAPDLFLLPASRELMGFEIEMAGTAGAETRLAAIVNALTGEYDYLILDPPPTVGLLTISALAASREVYIPMPMHFLAMEGLAEMMRLIYTVNANWNRNLMMMGVIPTFYNRHTRIAREITDDIAETFGSDRLLPGIRMNISLAEAPGHGQSVLDYAPRSAGAEDYMALAHHIETLRSQAAES